MVTVDQLCRCYKRSVTPCTYKLLTPAVLRFVPRQAWDLRGSTGGAPVTNFRNGFTVSSSMGNSPRMGNFAQGRELEALLLRSGDRTHCPRGPSDVFLNFNLFILRHYVMVPLKGCYNTVTPHRAQSRMRIYTSMMPWMHTFKMSSGGNRRWAYCRSTHDSKKGLLPRLLGYRCRL